MTRVDLRAFAPAVARAVLLASTLAAGAAACGGSGGAAAPGSPDGASSTAPGASAPPLVFEPPSVEARCASGDAAACATAADSLREADRMRAADLYGRACDAGSAYGCARGASLVQAIDPARAAGMLRVACDAGFDTSCNDLGFAAERGVGMPVDAALALSLYAKTCARGGAFGCFNQGIFVETGRGGGAPDEAGAARLYGAACDMKYDHACAALARMLYLGKGVAEDRPRATALLTASCDGGYPFACEFMTRHGIARPAP